MLPFYQNGRNQLEIGRFIGHDAPWFYSSLTQDCVRNDCLPANSAQSGFLFCFALFRRGQRELAAVARADGKWNQ
jgi:hypothetical protein